MPKRYVDIRLHIEEHHEDFGEDSYISYSICGVERAKFKGVSESDLEALAEHVAQEEKYQIYMNDAVASSLDSEGVYVL